MKEGDLIIHEVESRGDGGGHPTSPLHQPNGSAMMVRGQKHLLVPVDFTKDSLIAVRYALQVAMVQATQVTLLHVIDLNLNWPETGPANAAKIHQELWEEAAEKLGQMVNGIDAPSVPVCPMIKEGTPWEEIVGCARNHRVDLIVIGQRPRRFFRFPGGRHTARRVTERAPCPVLALPGDDQTAPLSDSSLLVSVMRKTRCGFSRIAMSLPRTPNWST